MVNEAVLIFVYFVCGTVIGGVLTKLVINLITKRGQQYDFVKPKTYNLDEFYQYVEEKKQQTK